MIGNYINTLTFDIIGYKKTITYNIDTLEEKNFIDKSLTINILPFLPIEANEGYSMDFMAVSEIYICQNVLDITVIDDFLKTLQNFNITNIELKQDEKLYICKIIVERIICL